MKDLLFSLPQNFADVLLSWYDEGHRDLPWRREISPYRTWISEIMLQQTRVEAVIPYFERFMEALPDIPALAAVDDDRLMKLWEGLGYYSRARNLKKAANVCVTLHGGNLPAAYDALIALPGIGDYTAGAVASIAFGERVPAVDGNVLRVLSRITADARDIMQPAAKAHFRALCADAVPADRPGDFNQAMMELGATLCGPNSAPKCAQCPMQAMCRGYQAGIAADLPVRSPKKPRRVEEHTVFVLRCGEEFALIRRGASGVLSRQWGFYDCPGHLDADEAQAHLESLGHTVCALSALPDAKHIFTHIEWRMLLYYAQVLETLPALHWMTREDIRESIAIPSAYRACAEAMAALP